MKKKTIHKINNNQFSKEVTLKQRNFIINIVVINAFTCKNQISLVCVLFQDQKEKKQ
jgi:hypothetical protein